MSKWINPTSDLIRSWAYDAESCEPEQDWDIIIHHLPFEYLYSELAVDKNCPKADYFLDLLYFTIGYSVRLGLSESNLARTRYVVDATKRVESYLLHIFRTRVHKLLEDPSLFSYDDWCCGGLTKRESSS